MKCLVKDKYIELVSSQKPTLLVLLVTALLMLVVSCGTSPEGSGSKVSNVEIRITPQNVTMVRGTNQLFQGKETTTTPTGSSVNATVVMDPKAFVWSIQEGPAGGTLIPSVTNPGFYLYTAPAAPGTYHVVITSRKDSSQSDVAQIEVH